MLAWWGCKQMLRTHVQYQINAAPASRTAIALAVTVCIANSHEPGADRPPPIEPLTHFSPTNPHPAPRCRDAGEPHHLCLLLDTQGEARLLSGLIAQPSCAQLSAGALPAAESVWQPQAAHRGTWNLLDMEHGGYAT